MPYDELAPLLTDRHLLVEMDRDEVWWLLFEYVDRRLGSIMAVRSELNRALEHDREKRAVRLARHRKRIRKGTRRAG